MAFRSSELSTAWLVLLILIIRVSAAADAISARKDHPKDSSYAVTHCVVCIDGHCNVPSSLQQQKLIIPFHGASYVSFCCNNKPLDHWCNSTLSMASTHANNASYLYYTWSFNNDSTEDQFCPPAPSSGRVERITRNISSLTTVISVPQGSCHTASILCHGGVHEENQSCVFHVDMRASLSDKIVLSSPLPQCSGAYVCMSGNCEMCPTSMTHWDPCQCSAPNGTVFPCMPCQQSTAKKAPGGAYRENYSAIISSTSSLPICTNSYACTDNNGGPKCYMCAPFNTISTTLNNLAFTCSPYGQPQPCQLNSAYSNATGPSMSWQWPQSSPYRLGAGSQQCFLNSLYNSSLAPASFGRAEIIPYILNDNFVFYAGYVPSGANDCSQISIIGTLTCNQDGYCGPIEVYFVGYPMPANFQTALVVGCTNFIETCSAELFIALDNLSPS